MIDMLKQTNGKRIFKAIGDIKKRIEIELESATNNEKQINSIWSDSYGDSWNDGWRRDRLINKVNIE